MKNIAPSELTCVGRPRSLDRVQDPRSPGEKPRISWRIRGITRPSTSSDSSQFSSHSKSNVQSELCLICVFPIYWNGISSFFQIFLLKNTEIVFQSISIVYSLHVRYFYVRIYQIVWKRDISSKLDSTYRSDRSHVRRSDICKITNFKD